MSHPICSLSLGHKWTLHPLVRWLICSLCFHSSPLHLIFSMYTQIPHPFKALSHTCALLHVILSLPVSSLWRSMRAQMWVLGHSFRDCECFPVVLVWLAELSGYHWKMIKSHKRKSKGNEPVCRQRSGWMTPQLICPVCGCRLKRSWEAVIQL